MQEAVRVKKEKNKLMDQSSCEETVEGYKAASKSARRAVARQKQRHTKMVWQTAKKDKEKQLGLRNRKIENHKTCTRVNR